MTEELSRPRRPGLSERLALSDVPEYLPVIANLVGVAGVVQLRARVISLPSAYSEPSG
jgi:hypothetical protein